MNLPAPGPFFNTPAARTALARERFFEQGQRPTGIVGEAVIQSWTRCLAAGLAPQQRPEFEPVSRARMKAVLERGHTLLQAAAPEVDQLETMLAGTGCKTVLTDREGVVVRSSAAGNGAGAMLDTLGRVGVYLGEPNFGSTAPGISVSAAQDCTVSGGEHFFGVLQHLYCAAAPVRDREGRVAGVLDVSVDGAPFGFDALALVRLAVAGIENRLLAVQSSADLLLRFQASPALLGTPLEGLAAVDGHGRVAGLNAAGARLLAQPGAPLGDDVQALFGLDPDALQRLLGARQPRPHRLPNGLQLWLRAMPPGHGTPAGAAPALDVAPLPDAPVATEAAPASSAPPASALRALSDQLVHDTLQRCHGNVSKAARLLGVSRGLLYRRLRGGRAA
ncbi:MAG: Fis family transcriptional regulator [Rubrivivax sp.]|nr:Fis family transcriptional regulator [Rubrivivax sp.]